MHPLTSFPIVQEKGACFTRVKKYKYNTQFHQQIVNLPDPYGDCVETSETSVSQCELRCVTKAVVEKCGCHDSYMEPYWDGEGESEHAFT